MSIDEGAAAQLLRLNERTSLVGPFLGSIAFGVHLTLFILCFQELWGSKRGGHDRLLLVYITLLFVLGNIGNAMSIKFTEMAYVDNRDYPGGPFVYSIEQSTNPIAVAGNVAYIINTWLQDGLLCYRFYVFSWSNPFLFAIPGLLFLASVVLSLFLIVMLCKPGITLWTKISINLAIPYWSISIALTVFITAFIVLRLLYMRRKIRRHISTGDRYLFITSMLVESAALYSITGIIFIVAYALNHPVQNLAIPVLGQMQSIAPLLIILRVARGSAWSQGTNQQIQQNLPLRFASNSQNTGSSTFLGSNKYPSQQDEFAESNHKKLESDQSDINVAYRSKRSLPVAI